MAVSVQSYVVIIPALFIILVIFVCLARGLWVYRLWTRRGFHIKDFEKLSSEAKNLGAETAKVHRSVVEDEALNDSIRKACLEIVNAASEYDTDIRIALAAWEDTIHPAGQDSDIENGKEEEAGITGASGGQHRRYVIASMRKRAMEGLDRRRRLSLQMQWMLKNVVSRYVLC